jgi:hypothetical protein
MEGPHISSSGDFNAFDTKKSKDKKKQAEAPNSDNVYDLNRRRHIAREALRHEEAPSKPARVIDLFTRREKLSERTPETDTDDEEEDDDPDAVLTAEEKQYAVQAIRRESQKLRHASPAESNAPPVIAVGDQFVDKWDDRIGDGEDPDSALSEVVSEHDIDPDILSAFADEADVVDSEGSYSDERPHEFTDDDIILNRPAEHIDVAASPSNETPVAFTEPAGEFVFRPQRADSKQESEEQPTRASEPAIPTRPEIRQVDRHNQIQAAPPSLIGDIIGNFIGHRRGRLKAEKKLLPIQQKLERQVNDLAWELKAKEAKLRGIAAEYVQRQGPTAIETLVAEAESKPHQKASSETVAITDNEISLADRIAARQLPEFRQKSPEAKQHLGEEAQTEQIGHVLVSAEQKGKEATQKTLDDKEQPLTNKRIETLSRPELLTLSGKIFVEGNSLRQIYETHLIGEHGLRRLVAEHIRGGNVQKALKRELVEHEIDPERDPALRDMLVPSDARSSETAQATAPGKAALNQLLQKAEAEISGTDDELAYYKDHEEQKSQSPKAHAPQNHIPDVIMGVAILGLAILVLVLFFSRG